MCTAPRVEAHPPSPISPFLLAQNLSLKCIESTDNMQPVISVVFGLPVGGLCQSLYTSNQHLLQSVIKLTSPVTATTAFLTRYVH